MTTTDDAANQDERARRERILLEANLAWERLMADPDIRMEFEAEDALWECTLLDGLEDEPDYEAR